MKRLAASIGPVLVLLALVLSSATAQTVFTGQLGMYTLSVPIGWTQTDRGKTVDVAFAAPGGEGRGSIYAGLKHASGSLEQEAAHAAGSSVPTGKRIVALNGVPCLAYQTVGSRGERGNGLMCQFTAPFKDGPSRVTFFMGSASVPADYASHTETFWQVANSVKWGRGITPVAADGASGGSDIRKAFDYVYDVAYRRSEKHPYTRFIYRYACQGLHIDCGNMQELWAMSWWFYDREEQSWFFVFPRGNANAANRTVILSKRRNDSTRVDYFLTSTAGALKAAIRCNEADSGGARCSDLPQAEAEKGFKTEVALWKRWAETPSMQKGVLD